MDSARGAGVGHVWGALDAGAPHRPPGLVGVTGCLWAAASPGSFSLMVCDKTAAAAATATMIVWSGRLWMVWKGRVLASGEARLSSSPQMLLTQQPVTLCKHRAFKSTKECAKTRYFERLAQCCVLMSSWARSCNAPLCIRASKQDQNTFIRNPPTNGQPVTVNIPRHRQGKLREANQTVGTAHCESVGCYIPTDPAKTRGYCRAKT